MTKGNGKKEKEIPKLRESLDFLDTSIEVKKPDVMQLFELVNQVEEKKAIKKNRQFIIFLIVALGAICLETYLYNRSVSIFITIQVLGLLCIVPSLVLFNRLRNRQVSH